MRHVGEITYAQWSEPGDPLPEGEQPGGQIKCSCGGVLDFDAAELQGLRLQHAIIGRRVKFSRHAGRAVAIQPARG